MIVKDIEHLEWIYHRLLRLEKISPNTDYMQKLQEIIDGEKLAPSYDTYAIIGKQLEPITFIKKEDINGLECVCGNKLNCTKKESFNWDRQEELLLECSKCGGKFILQSIIEDE